MTGPIEPYLKLGTICERVLQEKDGVLSLIRMVDRFTLTISGEEPPDQLPHGLKLLTIIMSWVGGLGSHEAAFNIISPSGETQRSPQTWSFTLDAINRGHNIIVTLPVSIAKEGVYWIEFTLNDQVKSRIPFQMIYERQKLRA
jgi:hypothetical protein